MVAARELALAALSGHGSSMVDKTDDFLLEDADDESGLIPYAPDFTPATLGKVIGEDNVLKALLEKASTVASKGDLQDAIAEAHLSHIAERTNRRDMASHVIQGLRNYLLIDIDDADVVRLTDAGKAVYDAADVERDAEFAKHILAVCGGFRLVEAIQRYELRAQRPTMELLNAELGRHPTEKSISSMRAWLARAGVLSKGGAYSVKTDGLAALVGPGVAKMLGLSAGQVEFLLAARLLEIQSGQALLEAPDVRKLAVARAPDVAIPSKSLGSFVRDLKLRDLVETVELSKGKGGTRVNLRLTLDAINLTEAQLKLYLAQSAAGIQLSELGTLADSVSMLTAGNAEQLGRAGERLAIHLCLMLGLRVTGWRARLPVEVDLTAERVAGFAYQRWHVQVKNFEGDLRSDRVDREIGAAAGTGATHLLFVIPRGGITAAARLESIAKSRLTPLHIYWLTAESLQRGDPVHLVRQLEGQQTVLVREKRNEAERRESS